MKKAIGRFMMALPFVVFFAWAFYQLGGMFSLAFVGACFLIAIYGWILAWLMED